MKRWTAFLLSAVLLFGALAPCAYAADAAGTPDAPGAAVLAFERAGGGIASVLSRLLKLITFTDEARILCHAPTSMPIAPAIRKTRKWSCTSIPSPILRSEKKSIHKRTAAF